MKYIHEDGTPFTKEEFLQKLKTDKEFNTEFGNKGIDQIQNLLNDLKTNPDSRRLMVNAWNVGKIEDMALPPCHFSFQVYTRELTFDERCEYAINEGWMTPLGALDFPETHYALDHSNTPKREISLKWNQRSVDTFLGLPFNISSYALLLILLAKEVNMVPGKLIGSFGDVHLYTNHLDPVNVQLSREIFPLPKLNLKTTLPSILNGDPLKVSDFELEHYYHGAYIKGDLSN